MRLSSEHSGQQVVTRADFSGGLNTSVAIEMIADNELSDCLNMDVDQSTKLLKTASGTKTLFKPSFTIKYVIYDKINSTWLFVDTDMKVYNGDLTTVSGQIGTLNGALAPKYTEWESGVLIASGGLLQYYDGTTFREINPTFDHDKAYWTEFTATAWAASTAYAVGNVVTNAGTYYRCMTAHTSDTTFSPTNWQALTSKGAWAQATAYVKNDFVTNSGKSYYCSTAHTSATKVTTCDDVYIRAGRVLVSYDDIIKYSGVGDEENWTEDSNDASTSKFIEAGYKDGGKIIAMTSLSDSVIVIKDNNRVYKISGEYPNWSVSEISRNADCRSRLSCCAVVDNTVMLGRGRLQIIQTTDQYGDMKIINTGEKVTKELASLPEDARLIFVPPLNQVWLIGTDGFVLVYDLTFGSFYKRLFNSPVLDVISINEDVYVVKADRISVLSAYHFADDDKGLKWWFNARRMFGHDELLLKRVQLSITPEFENFCDGKVWVGGFATNLPVPWYLMLVYKNRSSIHHNRVKLKSSHSTKSVYASGELVYENPKLIYSNRTKLWTVRDITSDHRCVFRDKKIDIRGYGANGAFVLNSINMDIVEV